MFSTGKRFLRLLIAVSVVAVLPWSLFGASQTFNATGQTVNNAVEWVAPGNAVGSPDDTCAATIDTPMTSWIQFTFPAFTIPMGETVTGVEVRVKYRSSNTNQVQLVIGGALDGSAMVLPLSFDGPSFCSSTDFRSAGGDGVLWGISEAALRAAATGGTLGFRLQQTNGPTLDIDAVELIVYFTEPNNPPNAVCQNVTVPADSMCQAAVTASQVDGGSTDPDGDMLTFQLSPAGPYALGDTMVTLTVSDGTAMDSCTATITVEDQTPPVISLTGGDLTLECGVDTFMEPGATATDNCDGSVTVDIGGDTVDTSTPGTYVITYDAQDAAGNDAVQLTRTVTVQDTIAPVITLNGDAEITLECGIDDYVEPGATASDACDSDVMVTTGGDTVDTGTPGTYLVTYDAVDDSGNMAAQVTRTVTVVDTTPPVIECNAPATITPPDAPITFTATAEDACEGPVTPEVTSFDCFWINPAGKPVDKTESCVVSFAGASLTIEDSGGVGDTIEWTVTAQDSFGNSAMETCSVTVAKPGKAAPASKLHFPQFGSGPGFSSELVLRNPFEFRSVSGELRFRDSDGQPMELALVRTDGSQSLSDFGSTVEFHLPPLGEQRFHTRAGGPLTSGSASVVADDEVLGTVRYHLEDMGTASLPGQQPVTSAVTAVRNGPESFTGIALHNPEEHEIVLSLSLRDSQGRSVPGGTTFRSLPAGGSLAVFFEDLFPEAAAGQFTGSLVIRSRDGAFVAMALEMGALSKRFSALPAAPIVRD